MSRYDVVKSASIAVARLAVTSRDGDMPAELASQLIVKEIDSVYVAGFNEAKSRFLEEMAKGRTKRV